MNENETMHRQQEAKAIADRLTAAAKHELYQTMKPENETHTYVLEKSIWTTEKQDIRELKDFIIANCEEFSRDDLSLSLKNLEVDRDTLREETIIAYTIEVTVTYK